MGARTLFEDVTITFNNNERYGLTGPNGCGKSTLFKIIMKLQEPTSGSVELPKKIGYLKQDIEHFQDFTALDCVIMGNERLWNALTERDSLYEHEITDEIGMKLAEIEEVIAEEDGYMAESDAEELLSGIGIPVEDQTRRMHTLPIDWQFRVLLCQALFGKPEALMLDEPTNHLDISSISWLENFLKGYDGTLIVVSHDKHFLNSITTHIADIDYETVIIYPGNYDDMLIAKTSIRSQMEDEIKNKEKKIARLKEFVSKFSAGSRASQVQSRLKEINKLQPQELKKSNIQRPYIRFLNPEKPSGQIVMKIEHISKQFEDNQVIKDFSLEVLRGEKIAVIGNNGLGKTTLLKMLAKVLEPDSGKVEYGHNILKGYFPQNHKDILEDTPKEETLFDYVKRHKSDCYDQDVRGVLGKLLFGGDDAFKEIFKLSGGETARMILATLMLQSPNTLILDEPNNHLDLESVSALAWGLNQFQGTVIFSSHDRDLISEVATKIISFTHEGIIVYSGTYEEYKDKYQ